MFFVCFPVVTFGAGLPCKYRTAGQSSLKFAFYSFYPGVCIWISCLVAGLRWWCCAVCDERLWSWVARKLFVFGPCVFWRAVIICYTFVRFEWVNLIIITLECVGLVGMEALRRSQKNPGNGFIGRIRFFFRECNRFRHFFLVSVKVHSEITPARLRLGQPAWSTMKVNIIWERFSFRDSFLRIGCAPNYHVNKIVNLTAVLFIYGK